MAMTISGTSGITYPDSTTQASGSQACKAWVNFNGTGVVAIRAQYNVTSITDNGTGNYTVNFTNALTDGNYAVSTGGCYTDNTSGERNFLVVTETFTTASFRVFGTDPTSGAATDYAIVSCAVFR